jgi:hypothetical protein
MFESSARHFCEKPIDDQATLDAALTMEDEDDLFDAGVEKGFLDTSVGLAYILSGIGEVALNLMHNACQYQIFPAWRSIIFTRH